MPNPPTTPTRLPRLSVPELRAKVARSVTALDKAQLRLKQEERAREERENREDCEHLADHLRQRGEKIDAAVQIVVAQAAHLHPPMTRSEVEQIVRDVYAKGDVLSPVANHAGDDDDGLDSEPEDEPEFPQLEGLWPPLWWHGDKRDAPEAPTPEEISEWIQSLSDRTRGAHMFSGPSATPGTRPGHKKILQRVQQECLPNARHLLEWIAAHLQMVSPKERKGLRQCVQAIHRLFRAWGEPIDDTGREEEWIPASEAVRRANERGFRILASDLSRAAKAGDVDGRPVKKGRVRLEVRWESVLGWLDRTRRQNAPNPDNDADEPSNKNLADIEARKKAERELKSQGRSVD